MATLKLSGSIRVPKEETGKSLSQGPLSFCAVAINLALVTWSASRSILSQFFLIGMSQDFWRLESSGKKAPPLALLQDFASLLVSAMLILETIVSTNWKYYMHMEILYANIIYMEIL